MKPNPKIIILGESSTFRVMTIDVGKSSLIQTLIQGTFNQKHGSTLGVCFHRYDCKLTDGFSTSIDVWDTAGQQKYRSLLSIYYKNAQGALLIFDITSAQSLQTVRYWTKELEQNADPGISVILVGNKCDLINEGINSAVKEEIVNDLVKRRPHWKFFKVSAKTGQNVENVFRSLTEMILDTGQKKVKRDAQKQEILKIRKSRKRREQRACC